MMQTSFNRFYFSNLINLLIDGLGALVSPSISAHYGITEADYYQKRTRPEIQGILTVAKITVDETAFNAAWEKVQGIFSRFRKTAFNYLSDDNCEASLIAIKNELSN